MIIYLFLEIELKIARPVFFFNAEGYNSNLRPTFHGALVDQTVWRRANNVAEVFTGNFKVLSTESHYIFQQFSICAKST